MMSQPFMYCVPQHISDPDARDWTRVEGCRSQLAKLLGGVVFVPWCSPYPSSSDWVALTWARVTLCATGFCLYHYLDGCHHDACVPLAPAAPGRAHLVALTFLYFRHCRKCLKDKSKQKQYRESVKKNALQLSLFQTITNTTVHSFGTPHG